MKMIVFPLWLDSNKEPHYPFSPVRELYADRVFLMIFMIRHIRVTAVTLDSIEEFW